MEMVVEIDGDGSGGTSRPGRVPEQRLSIPGIFPLVVAALRKFFWKNVEPPGVFRSEGNL